MVKNVRTKWCVILTTQYDFSTVVASGLTKEKALEVLSKKVEEEPAGVVFYTIRKDEDYIPFKDKEPIVKGYNKVC